MGDRLIVDAHEVVALAADLAKAGSVAVKELRPVVSRGALNIKREMQADAAASRHFAQVAPTITYDVSVGVGSVSAEIGPDRARGASAGLAGAYLGWPGGGGGTLPTDTPLDNEKPGFEKALSDLVGRLL